MCVYEPSGGSRERILSSLCLQRKGWETKATMVKAAMGFHWNSSQLSRGTRARGGQEEPRAQTPKDKTRKEDGSKHSPDTSQSPQRERLN